MIFSNLLFKSEKDIPLGTKKQYKDGLYERTSEGWKKVKEAKSQYNNIDDYDEELEKYVHDITFFRDQSLNFRLLFLLSSSRDEAKPTPQEDLMTLTWIEKLNLKNKSLKEVLKIFINLSGGIAFSPEHKIQIKRCSIYMIGENQINFFTELKNDQGDILTASSRSLRINSEGNLIVDFNNIEVNEGKKLVPNLGTKMLYNEINECRKLGITEIKIKDAVKNYTPINYQDKQKRNAALLGHYVWPLLGFSSDKAKNLEEIKDWLYDFNQKYKTHYNNLDELLSDEKGREEWKMNGFTLENLYFNPSPNSKNSQIFEQYFQNKIK